MTDVSGSQVEVRNRCRIWTRVRGYLTFTEVGGYRPRQTGLRTGQPQPPPPTSSASLLSSVSVSLLIGISALTRNQSLMVIKALVYNRLFIIRCSDRVCVCVCVFECALALYPHVKLPTALLADLTALTAAPKLKYSSLIRCLQHMIYFDVPGPAVENIHGQCHVLETEYSYSSICYIQTRSLLFSRIDFGC